MRTHEYLKKIPNLKGQTFIVTGANSGLGFALSEHLIAKEAHVIMANRNEDKTTQAISKLLKKYPNAAISFFYFDQSDSSAIDHFVQRLEENYQHIDGIIFNAGVYFPEAKGRTRQGLPLTFGINFYGNYLLTKKIMSSSLVSSITRFVYTTSPAAFKKMSRVRLIKVITGDGSTRHQQYKGAKWALNSLAWGLMENNQHIPFPIKGQAYLYHPGVSNSNIARFKFKPLNDFAHLFMKVMFHSPRRAVLGALVALTTTDDLKGMMIVPRGLLEVNGLPRYKKMDGNVSDHLFLLLNEIAKINLKQ